ncbi:hypothetical protein HYH02_014614 [Chlamydomonas schloesseri]|uniref:Methyltransferase domain-containing protein n=1 Tax=Chlamydomonas schloesseri TaxID=2026947 RepID=A0A835VVU9_9CHLO|nr:hypothetical protein HYH02_014614 [Chlamydomonas schloesseri]|eukprot:KAG2427394.1 hypothetical protein HYH02_014614 [Chlamydomonas schloesseri]
MAAGAPQGHARYDNFKPLIGCPPGKKLSEVGSPPNRKPGEDGGKWLCTPLEPEGPECVVYSLGSASNYYFEEDVLRTTNCKVWTYDCTVDGRSSNPERHFFHKKCVGPNTFDGMFSNYISWDGIVKSNNHTHVYILKADVEGFEWGFLSSWRADTPGLPYMLAVEFHLDRLSTGPGPLQPNPGADVSRFDQMWMRQTISQVELALFFQHLASLGYAPISREDNPWGTCCAEYVFLRVESHRRTHARPPVRRRR